MGLDRDYSTSFQGSELSSISADSGVNSRPPLAVRVFAVASMAAGAAVVCAMGASVILHKLENAAVQDPNYCSHVPENCELGSDGETLIAPSPMTLAERVNETFAWVNDNNLTLEMREPVTAVNGTSRYVRSEPLLPSGQ